MSIAPKIRSGISHGPQLHVLGGQFTYGAISIPYFTAHMTIAEVRDFLETPAEISQWTDEDQEIEALYQRSIDYKRVEKGLLRYLREESAERPKFFNSLTVALIPRQGGSFVPYSNETLKAPTQLPRETNTRYLVKTGPLLVGTYKDYASDDPDSYLLAELCWNKEQVACVAIDGQHRLHALKRMYGIDPEVGKNTKISVIFIVPSEDLGYSHRYASDEEAVLRLLRSVFIDLNKHAVPVKRTRLILLDDADPHSILVRRLLGQRLESIHLPPIGKDDHRLPLPLVDWHGEDAKFDQGPYITSVLMLDKVVQTLTGCKAVKDWTDVKAVERQYDAFKKLGYEPSEECVKELEDYRAAEEDWQHPFTYPRSDLDLIKDTVGDNLAEIVWHVLTRINAFKTLIEARGTVMMLSADFSSWYERYASKDNTEEDLQAYRTVKQHIQNKDVRPNISEWEDFLTKRIPQIKDDYLPYKVVFQGAMFEALKELFRIDQPVLGPGDVYKRETQDHRMYWVQALIQMMNTLEEKEAAIWQSTFNFDAGHGVRTTFWLGSVVSVGNLNIDFTSAGTQRAAAWIKILCLLWVSAEEWKNVNGTLEIDEFEVFLKSLADEDADFERKIQQERSRIAFGGSNNEGAMKRVAKAQHPQEADESDEDYDERIEKLAKEEFARRIQRIWSVILSAHG